MRDTELTRAWIVLVSGSPLDCSSVASSASIPSNRPADSARLTGARSSARIVAQSPRSFAVVQQRSHSRSHERTAPIQGATVASSLRHAVPELPGAQPTRPARCLLRSNPALMCGDPADQLDGLALDFFQPKSHSPRSPGSASKRALSRRGVFTPLLHGQRERVVQAFDHRGARPGSLVPSARVPA